MSILPRVRADLPNNSNIAILISQSKSLVTQLYEIVREPSGNQTPQTFESLVQFVHQNSEKQEAINSICLQLHASNYIVNLNQYKTNSKLYSKITQGIELVNKLETTISELKREIALLQQENSNHVDSIDRLNRVVDFTQDAMKECKSQLLDHSEKIHAQQIQITALEKSRLKRDFVVDFILVCISSSLVRSEYLDYFVKRITALFLWKRRQILHTTRLAKFLIFLGILLKARGVCEKQGFHSGFGRFVGYLQFAIDFVCR